jgi:NTP pyrophosphatase (non-canonical NTP hydrolase)
MLSFSTAIPKHEDQDSVYAWIKEAFPEYDSLRARTAALVEETCELALAAGMTIADIRNVVEATFDRVKHQKEMSIPEESGDVFNCLLALAGQQNFDLQEQLEKKMALNRSRPFEYYHKKTQLKKELGLKL